MQCRYDFAASSVREGLICLKLAMLKLILFLTFLMCFLKVRLESRVTPRNLNWGTSSSSSSSSFSSFVVVLGAGPGAVWCGGGGGWGGGGMAWGGRGVAWGGRGEAWGGGR